MHARMMLLGAVGALVCSAFRPDDDDGVVPAVTSMALATDVQLGGVAESHGVNSGSDALQSSAVGGAQDEEQLEKLQKNASGLPDCENKGRCCVEWHGHNYCEDIKDEDTCKAAFTKDSNGPPKTFRICVWKAKKVRRVRGRRVDGVNLNPWERRFRQWARANDLLEIDELKDDADCAKKAKLFLERCEEDPTLEECQDVYWEPEKDKTDMFREPEPQDSYEDAGSRKHEEDVAQYSYEDAGSRGQEGDGARTAQPSEYPETSPVRSTAAARAETSKASDDSDLVFPLAIAFLAVFFVGEISFLAGAIRV